jgi:hypothetical protein
MTHFRPEVHRKPVQQASSYALAAYSGACEYRFRGDVNKDSGDVNRDSGDVNNLNRDKRGGLEPGLILTFLDQAF